MLLIGRAIFLFGNGKGNCDAVELGAITGCQHFGVFEGSELPASINTQEIDFLLVFCGAQVEILRFGLRFGQSQLLYLEVLPPRRRQWQNAGCLAEALICAEPIDRRRLHGKFGELLAEAPLSCLGVFRSLFFGPPPRLRCTGLLQHPREDALIIFDEFFNSRAPLFEFGSILLWTIVELLRTRGISVGAAAERHLEGSICMSRWAPISHYTTCNS
mmetsp:Transcript_42792/g.118200  ORF Transcript_42792/g.118200 Transcript_42792/m.118200 type:complete len:216 (+) Transcript_42792:761-1408(+)